MLRSIRSAIALVAVVAAVVAAVTWLAMATSRRWYEKDLIMRAEVVAQSAETGILDHWKAGDRKGVARVLGKIARDERILAAVGCTADGEVIAATELFPREFTCSRLVAGMGTPLQSWHFADQVNSGSIFVSAVPLHDGAAEPAFVALVHDMSYVERRENQFRRFALIAFLVLAGGAVVVNVTSYRGVVRALVADMREILLSRGRGGERTFQPLLRDVRDLVARLSAEADAGAGARAWDPQRLKETLSRVLEGDRVVVLANREPYIHERRADGLVDVLHPASGLVTALEPVMRACSGVWVAHGSGSADRDTVDRDDRIAVPPEDPSYQLRRVWLSTDEERGYYYGFSNEGLWPLCHVAHARPDFRAEDFERYRTVNQKFAWAVCDEAKTDDPIILVQDYHFALAPRMIREALPRATVVAFWHIPFPYAERFAICPWRTELLQGMLGASILGFHTRLHANNFLDSVDRFLEARVDREANSVSLWRRETQVRAYPISIEWPNRWVASAPPVDECRASVRRELGLAPDALVAVGVDRLDYTKGVEERLAAVERALEMRPDLKGRFVFVQLSAPSRTAIPRYRELQERVEALTARINARFGSPTWKPIVLRRSHHEPPEVFRHLRAADVCVVSSVHDGMNLVAKEFVAARDDEQGALVLSEFTGASRELTEALIVNPYDIERSAAALIRGLEMPAAEQRARMRAMRAFVGRYNVYRWAGRMLDDAARLRDQGRLERIFREPALRRAG